MRSPAFSRRAVRVFYLSMILVLIAGSVAVVPAGAAGQTAPAAPTQRTGTLSLRAQTQPQPSAAGSGAFDDPEFLSVGPDGKAPATPGKVYAGNLVNRPYPRSLAALAPLHPSPLVTPTVRSMPVANPKGDLAQSFQGINHYQQRTANGGNQFSLEPPDQGLCVGNGYVMETVNDALRVYDE
jgi:hypothetical protein